MFRSSSPRGAGYLFGAKVTHDFMKINALSLICRAHQLVHEGNLKYICPLTCTVNYLFLIGFKYMFDDKLVTVWSAPNYCYRCGNVASILEFHTAENAEAKIFSAVPDAERIIPARNVTPYFL